MSLDSEHGRSKRVVSVTSKSGNAVDLNNNSTIPEALMDEELNTVNQPNIQQELEEDEEEEPIEDEYS